jgi:hypothetical protein
LFGGQRTGGIHTDSHDRCSHARKRSGAPASPEGRSHS